MMKRIIFLWSFCLLSVSGFCVDIYESPVFASFNYIQIKESANFGLVFSGKGLDYGMRWEKEHDKFNYSYDFKLGLSIISAMETSGTNVNIKPVQFSYLTGDFTSNQQIKIGGALKGEYHWQNYKELQGGYSYWLTNYCLGLAVKTTFDLGNGTLDLRYFNNLIGMTSRNEIYDDPYFYKLSPAEVLKDLHQDFTFATLDSYNNSVIEMKYSNRSKSRFSISYTLDYNNYYRNPQLEILTHSIRIYFN